MLARAVLLRDAGCIILYRYVVMDFAGMLCEEISSQAHVLSFVRRTLRGNSVGVRPKPKTTTTLRHLIGAANTCFSLSFFSFDKDNPFRQRSRSFDGNPSTYADSDCSPSNRKQKIPKKEQKSKEDSKCVKP